MGFCYAPIFGRMFGEVVKQLHGADPAHKRVTPHTQTLLDDLLPEPVKLPAR